MALEISGVYDIASQPSDAFNCQIASGTPTLSLFQHGR